MRKSAFVCFKNKNISCSNSFDATNDDRFKNNPLVTGSPFIRFYAGLSMLTSGTESTACEVEGGPTLLNSLETSFVIVSSILDADTPTTAVNQPPKVRVLVMDDSPIVQKLLSRWFSTHGCDVVVAANGMI
eukprot:gene40069-49549_t